MRARFLWVATRDDDRLAMIARGLHATLPNRLACGPYTVFLSADAPWLGLPAIDGGIVGRLYSGNGAERRSALASAEQLAIMSTGGRSLINQHSGAYVAFWRGAGDGFPIALRDPSACLPAVHIAIDGDWFVASDPSCLELAGLLRPVPDPDGLAQYLAYPATPSDRTCLAGVEELRPGALTTLTDRVASELIWRPGSFKPLRAADPPALAKAIDAVASGICRGWRRPGVELSGGLDSSIIAAAIGDGRGTPAIHMVPEAPDADERRYAGLVISRFGMARCKVPITYDDIDALLPPVRLTARPTNVTIYREMDRKLHAARGASGADVSVSGAGGDSVFGMISSTGFVIDAWRDGGVTEARATVAALALLAEVSTWDVYRHLWRRLLKQSIGRWSWPADLSLLGPAGAAARPPDVDLVADLPPGRRAYVANVLRMQTILDAHDRVGADDMQFPIMAQPVLEACLAMPSWAWLAGGRDRAIARQAYANRLPTQIIERRGKGRYDALLIRAYERARPAIRDMLLDGWLASRKLIDPHAVARAIDEPVTAIDPKYERVLRLWDAENWCRFVLSRQ